MKKLSALLLVALLLIPVALRAEGNAADTLTRFLAPDSSLIYVRPTLNSPVSILTNARAAILDLRYLPADAKHADACLSAIGDYATPAHPCFLLISPETSPAILKGIGAGLTGVITIGRTAPGCHPDVTVDTTAESDHAAWMALGSFSSPDVKTRLEKLITPVIDKPRYDEAALVKEHAAALNESGDDASDADDAPPSPSKKEAAKPAADTPAPLIDAVLLRAVQIDRGLIALRKL